MSQFNPKELLEKIRKNKIIKEEASTFLADNNGAAPLFQVFQEPQTIETREIKDPNQ